MTTTLDRSSGDPSAARLVQPPTRGQVLASRVPAWVASHGVVLCVALTVVLRLPMLGRPPGLDEAGFLTVARQWNAAGSSLYGDYWVDRPPLLITVFRAAAVSGGLVPLRLIGCLAAALTVWGVAHLAARIAAHEGYRSRVAGPWAAVVAAAWCLSPLTGSSEVNGELLAAPLVAWGAAAALSAVWSAVPGPQRAVCAAAAGAASIGALAVKQNFVDVGVFAVALVLIAVLRRELSRAVAVRLAAWFAGGAAGCGAALCAWTSAHGTSLGGVFYAMYPFRVAAARVIATSTNAAPSQRLGQLALAWGLSGMALVTVLLLVAVLASARARSTVQLALGALVLFDALSILLGGNYWLHYLVQLVVPLGVLTGVAAARRVPGARTSIVVLASGAALVLAASGALLPSDHVTGGSALGRAVGAAARPGDTVVTLYGHSDVTQQSGLPSPYPYLWSLPLKTLDPSLEQLDHVLTGPDAPTWVVTWAHVTSWGVRSGATSSILARHYHVATVVQGHTIYLHDGLERPRPSWPAQAPRPGLAG